MLSKAQDGPGQAASPGGEGRIALLGAGAAVAAVLGVEQRFVRHAPAHVIAVAAFPVVDRKARGGFGVLDQAFDERHFAVRFLVQRKAKPVRNGQRTQRADGIHKKRMRAVERVDVSAAVGDARPACSLDGAAGFERQPVVIPLRLCGLDFALAGQPCQVAEGADHVESMIVDAGVGGVAFHPLPRSLASALEEPGLAGGVKLQQRRSVLEPARPVGPVARLVAPLHGYHGRAAGRVPRLFDAPNLRRRQLKQPLEFGAQCLREKVQNRSGSFRLTTFTGGGDGSLRPR